MKITDLQPKGTFRYFSDIAAIPHGSGNTAEIQSYCVNFAKAHGLRYIHDDAGNVIIFADGTRGYENSPAVILQGHLDMVCDKTPDSAVDMSKEGFTTFKMCAKCVWEKNEELNNYRNNITTKSF